MIELVASILRIPIIRGLVPWNDPHLKPAFVAIAPLHDVVYNDVRAARMHDALALPAVCCLIIADFAVAVDGPNLGSYQVSANNLIEQLHDFSAIACREIWWNQHRHPFACVSLGDRLQLHVPVRMLLKPVPCRCHDGVDLDVPGRPAELAAYLVGVGE